jgi:hypothetical protein
LDQKTYQSKEESSAGREITFSVRVHYSTANGKTQAVFPSPGSCRTRSREARGATALTTHGTSARIRLDMKDTAGIWRYGGFSPWN